MSAAVFVFAAGCISSPAKHDLTDTAVAARFLPWLTDGRTTRAQTVQTLGAPTAIHEAGRIAGYRLFVSNPKKKVDSAIARTDYGQNFGPINADSQLLVARTPRGELDEMRWRAVLAPANYDLVLVFDARDVLCAHRLRLAPP
jgi:hypothetical protein